MGTLSIDYAKKLLLIRKAEGLTQAKFAEITNLSVSTIKGYETGQRPARAEVMEKVLRVDEFQKYTLWLIHDKAVPAAGQIAPVSDVIDSESQNVDSFSDSAKKQSKA
ncbi:XRE family transcriptional regulator [Lelliottia aquatilis]|uniref:helix-turn-helix domain-containing protein n=1 Tax=Lelliottia aquatilis TaxID=2080838 RepID=UPI000CDEAD49|nr:helix-turn-helix transcriptional regulator [Lelliottia aquatilis]POZ17018.1 XRE family transcriptional regulator [Lelliottia aquatilis]